MGSILIVIIGALFVAKLSFKVVFTCFSILINLSKTVFFVLLALLLAGFFYDPTVVSGTIDYLFSLVK